MNKAINCIESGLLDARSRCSLKSSFYNCKSIGHCKNDSFFKNISETRDTLDTLSFQSVYCLNIFRISPGLPNVTDGNKI